MPALLPCGLLRRCEVREQQRRWATVAGRRRIRCSAGRPGREGRGGSRAGVRACRDLPPFNIWRGCSSRSAGLVSSTGSGRGVEILERGRLSSWVREKTKRGVRGGGGRGLHFVFGSWPPGSGLAWGGGSDGFRSARTVGRCGATSAPTPPRTVRPRPAGPSPGFGAHVGRWWPRPAKATKHPISGGGFVVEEKSGGVVGQSA
jgi:hypothetical protein